MADKLKYPIGAKVRFLYNNTDKGKLGTVVGIQDKTVLDKTRYLVFISTTSSYHYGYARDGVKFAWRCLESQIELAYGKNEQLMFSFMNE